MSAPQAANELAVSGASDGTGALIENKDSSRALNGVVKEGKKRPAPGDDDSAEKLAARREANRIHAFKSRQRSKALLQEMQRTVERLSGEKAGLERENAVLRAQVDVLQNQNMALTQSQRMLLIRAGQLGAAAAAAAAVGGTPGAAPVHQGPAAGNAPNGGGGHGMLSGVPGQPMMTPGPMAPLGAPMGNMHNQQQQQPVVGAPEQEAPTPNGNANGGAPSAGPEQPPAALAAGPAIANIPPGVPLGCPPAPPMQHPPMPLPVSEES